MVVVLLVVQFAVVSPESMVVSLESLMVHSCCDGLACVGLVLQTAELVEYVVVLVLSTEHSECLIEVDPLCCPSRIALVCHPCIRSDFSISGRVEPLLVLLLVDCHFEQWKVVDGRRLCSSIVVLVVSPQSKRPMVVVVVVMR